MSNLHYDSEYFAWQKDMGSFGGKANTFKFLKSIKKDDCVVDFGCGGGFLLKNLECRRKIGIEINLSASKTIQQNGVEWFDSAQSLIDQAGEGFADVIISDNVLEHTPCPLFELKSLRSILKKNGIIHFVVPCDNISLKYKPNDINNHLYSFSPMNLGNLFTEAGYTVQKVKPYIHKWPPYYRAIQNIFGWRIFNIFCRVYGRIDRDWYQVEIIATKSHDEG